MNPEAAVAYDAWQQGRTDLAFDYAAFVALALATYEARYPAPARAHRVFFTERCGGDDWKNHRMDVYCTFCGGLLLPRIMTSMSPASLPRVVRHTTGCALACLGGLRAMAPPGTRGLTDEDRVGLEPGG